MPVERWKVDRIAETPASVPADELAEQIGESRTVVYYWRNKLGLTNRKTDQEWDHMIRRVLAGELVKKVAEENDVAENTLLMRLYRAGYEKRWVKVR